MLTDDSLRGIHRHYQLNLVVILRVPKADGEDSTGSWESD